VVAFAHGLLSVVFDVGWLSFVPTLVGPDRIVGANSRLQASASAAQVGGPGLAGVLIQLVSAPMTLTVDALSFVFSAITLRLIQAREIAPSADARRHLLTEIGDGLRVTFGNRVLRAMALNAGAVNLFDQLIYTVFLLYAVGVLGLAPALVGAAIGSGAVGGFLGALLAGPLARRLGIGPAMIAMSFVECSTVVAIPFVTGPQLVVTVLLAGVFFVQGLGAGVSNVHFVSLRQAITAPELLGRMNASYRTISFGAIPLGALLGGVLGQTIGLRAALIVGAVGLLATPLLVLFSPVRQVRTLPAVADATP
jgi:Na+/melibiose symporter-like transporter